MIPLRSIECPACQWARERAAQPVSQAQPRGRVVVLQYDVDGKLERSFDMPSAVIRSVEVADPAEVRRDRGPLRNVFITRENADITMVIGASAETSKPFGVLQSHVVPDPDEPTPIHDGIEHGPIAFRCSWCGARPYTSCTSPGGDAMPNQYVSLEFHQQRIEAAEEIR